MSALFEDITSRDPGRVRASACAIIALRDTAELDLLARRLPEIREKTRALDLGGGLIANREHLQFALRKLAYYGAKSGCLCLLYPEYPMHDPGTVNRHGNIRITGSESVEWDPVDAILCECTLCETAFRVEDRENLSS